LSIVSKHLKYRSYCVPQSLELRKWLQAAGVSIGARHRNLRPGINVSKQFGAGWAQKRTRKKLYWKRGGGAGAKLFEKANEAI
jgi:hypothetical protein